MILADTSVWVDHIRDASVEFQERLAARQVLMHPWVLGELALGNLHNRPVFLRFLSKLPRAKTARDPEVMAMIEENTLHGIGIGWVDAHLAAAARLSRASLWTRDRRLMKVAQRLDIPAHGFH